MGELTVQRNLTSINVKDYGATGNGTTDDTAAIAAAFAALPGSFGTLYFPAGTYRTTDLLFRSASNFTLRGDRGSVIYSSPNTTVSPGQATHDVCIIADCTDFSIDGLTFDGRRDTIAGDQYLTANAASGQRNVTVQDGTKYVVGQGISVSGGLTANGGTEKTFADWFLTITAITGNTLTLSSNLTHSYTGTGASGGAYLTQYQIGGVVAYSIAGRNLGNEDAQNGLHLISCQRFVIRNCVAQNTWESPIKMGTGFQTTSPTDGCSYGIVTGNMAKHGYDQGISVWNSQYITVVGNKCEDAGWAGISLSHGSDSTVSGNICINNLYSPPTDLNEGTGIAAEGAVRCVIANNVCSGNNSNGIRLNNSPMFGNNTSLATTSGSLSAGATSITLSASNANMVNGASFTIIDPSNNLIRETIYVTGGSNPYTISPGLRNAYASGATISARYNDNVTISNNICSLNALSAGIHTDYAINLKVFSNDCSKNGFLNGAFVDTLGTHGIHLHGFCQEAIVEANTCSFNVKDGIFIDNDNKGVVVQGNGCNRNGLKGTNSQQGINLFGCQDVAAIGNICNGNTNNGIYTQNGNLSTTHCSLIGNTCMYNNSSGIWLDNGGKGMLVQGNKIAYNLDAGMKVLGYKDSTFIGNQCYNQNGQEGIRFDDNGSNFCTDNKVLNNELFDDQGSPTQSWGFRELNNSARTILQGNRIFGNTNAAQVSMAATSALVSDLSYRTATATDYTALFTDDVIAVTSTASARIVTLPAPSAVPGHTYIVKDESGGAATHTITVKSASGTIDATLGSTGVAISTNYGVLRLYSNGTNYYSI